MRAEHLCLLPAHAGRQGGALHAAGPNTLSQLTSDSMNFPIMIPTENIIDQHELRKHCSPQDRLAQHTLSHLDRPLRTSAEALVSFQELHSSAKAA